MRFSEVTLVWKRRGSNIDLHMITMRRKGGGSGGGSHRVCMHRSSHRGRVLVVVVVRVEVRAAPRVLCP